MARLLSETYAHIQSRLDEAALRHRLREQIAEDLLLDRIASLIGDGWFSLVVADNARRLARATPRCRARVIADNQARLIRAYHDSKPCIEVHDAAETAEDHGLQPRDLRTKVSGRRKRHRAKTGRFGGAASIDVTEGTRASARLDRA